MARHDADAEQRAHDRLLALGVRRAWNSWERRPILQIAVTEVPRVVRTLVSEGWQVRGDGHRYRLATAPPALDIRSGVDWFELHGEVRFDEHRVALPALLDAIKSRQGTITLDDGTFGIVPEAWLREFAPLAIGARGAGPRPLRAIAGRSARCAPRGQACGVVGHDG